MPQPYLAWNPQRTSDTEVGPFPKPVNARFAHHLLDTVQTAPNSPSLSPRFQIASPLLTNPWHCHLSFAGCCRPQSRPRVDLVSVPSALSSPSRPRSSFSADVVCTFPDITLRFLLLNQLKKVLCRFTIGKELCVTWNEQTTKLKAGAGWRSRNPTLLGTFPTVPLSGPAFP